MANNNLPQNLDYGKLPALPALPALPNIPSLPTLPNFKIPDMSNFQRPTVGSNLGNTIIQSPNEVSKYTNFNPIKYDLGKTYQAFPQGTTEIPLSEDYIKNRILPTDSQGRWVAGSPTTVARPTDTGGAYAYDPTNPDKLIKTDSQRIVSGEMRNKVIGGTPAFYQIDHVRPIMLGGLDEPYNLQTYDIFTHAKKTKIQAVPLTLLHNNIINLQEAQALSDSWEKRSMGGLPTPDNTGYVPLDQAEEALKRWKYEEANNIVEIPDKKTSSGLSDLILNKIPKSLESGSFIPFAGAEPSIPKEIIKGAVTGLTGLPYIPQQGVGTAGQVAGYVAYLPAFLFSFGKWIKGASKALWGAETIVQGVSKNFLGQTIVTKAVPAATGLVDRIAESLGGLGVFQNILRASSVAKGVAGATTAAVEGEQTVSTAEKIAGLIGKGVTKADEILASGSEKIISAVNKIPKLPESLKLGPKAFEGLTTAGILKGGATMATANIGAKWYDNLYEVTDQKSVVPIASNFLKDFLSFSMYGAIPKGADTIFNASRVSEFGVGTMASIILDGADSGEALLNGAIFATMGAMDSPAAQEKILKSRIGGYYRAMHTSLGDLWRNKLAVESLVKYVPPESGQIVDPHKFVSWMSHEKLNEKLPNNTILEKKIGQNSFDRTYTIEEIENLYNQSREQMKNEAVELLKSGKMSQEEVRDFLQKERSTYDSLIVGLAANGKDITPEQKDEIIGDWIRNKANMTAAPTEYQDSIEGFNQGEYGSYPKEIATLVDALNEKPDSISKIIKKDSDPNDLNIPRNSYLTGITASGGGGEGPFKKEFASGLETFSERNSNGYNKFGKDKMILYKDDSISTRDQIEASNAVKQDLIDRKVEGYEKLRLNNPDNVWKIISVTENPKTGSLDIIPHGNLNSEGRMNYFNNSMESQGGKSFMDEYNIHDSNLTSHVNDYVTMADGTPLKYLVVDIKPLEYCTFKTKLGNYHLQFEITNRSYKDGKLLQSILMGKEVEIGMKIRQNIKEFNDHIRARESQDMVGENAIPMPGKVEEPGKVVTPTQDEVIPAKESPSMDTPAYGAETLPQEPSKTPIVPPEQPVTPPPPVDIPPGPPGPPKPPVKPPESVSAAPLEPEGDKGPELDFSKPIDINKSVEEHRKQNLEAFQEQEDIKNLDQKANPTDEPTQLSFEEELNKDLKNEEESTIQDKIVVIPPEKELTTAEKVAALIKKSQNAASSLPQGLAKKVKEKVRKRYREVSVTSIVSEGPKTIKSDDYSDFGEGGTLGGITKRIKNEVIRLHGEGVPYTDPKIQNLLKSVGKYAKLNIREAAKKYDNFDDFLDAFKKSTKDNLGLDAFDTVKGKDDYDQVQTLRHLFEKIKQLGKPTPSIVLSQNKDGSINFKGTSEKLEHEPESTLFKNVRESTTKNPKIKNITIWGVMNPDVKTLAKDESREPIEFLLSGDARENIKNIYNEFSKKDIFFLESQGGVKDNSVGVHIPKEEQDIMEKMYDDNKERYAVSDPEMLDAMKKEGTVINKGFKVIQVFFVDVAKLGKNFSKPVSLKRMAIINNRAIRNPEKGELKVIALPGTELSKLFKEHPEVFPEYIRKSTEKDPTSFKEYFEKIQEDGQEFYLKETKDKIRHNIGATGESTNLQGTTYEPVLDKNGDIVGNPILIKGNGGILTKELKEYFEKKYGIKIDENTKIIFKTGLKSGEEHFEIYNSPENLNLPPEEQAITRTISNDFHRYMFEKPKTFDPSGSYSTNSALKIPADAIVDGRPVAPDFIKFRKAPLNDWMEAYDRIYIKKESPQKVLQEIYGNDIGETFFGSIGKIAKANGSTVVMNRSIEKFLGAKFRDDVMHARGLDSGYFKMKADTGVVNGKPMEEGYIMMSRAAYENKLRMEKGREAFLFAVKNPVTRPLAQKKMKILIGEDYGQMDLGLDQVIVNIHDTAIGFEADTDGDGITLSKILTNNEVDMIKDGERMAGVPESIVNWFESERVRYAKESPVGGMNLHQGVAKEKYPKLPAADRRAALEFTQDMAEGKVKLGGTTNSLNKIFMYIANIKDPEIRKKIFTVNGKVYEPKYDFKEQDEGGRTIQMEVDSPSSRAFAKLPEWKKNPLFTIFGLGPKDSAIIKQLEKNIRGMGYDSILTLNKNKYESLPDLLGEISKFVNPMPKDPQHRHMVQELFSPLKGFFDGAPQMSKEFKRKSDNIAVMAVRSTFDAPDMTPKVQKIVDTQTARQEKKSDIYKSMSGKYGEERNRLDAEREDLSDLRHLYDDVTSVEDSFSDADKKALSWFVSTNPVANKFYDYRFIEKNKAEGYVERAYDMMIPEHAEVFYKAQQDYFTDPGAAREKYLPKKPTSGGGSDLVNRLVAESKAKAEIIETKTQEPIKTSTNIYAGTGENASLSNMANRPFTLEGKKFNSVEQYFQAAKMSFISSDVTSKEAEHNKKVFDAIMKSDNPWDSKKLGKEYKNLDTKKWDLNNSDIMKKALETSFEQNPSALDILKKTGTSELTHTQDKGKWGKEFPKLLKEIRDKK